jgi:hypothetical protein
VIGVGYLKDRWHAKALEFANQLRARSLCSPFECLVEATAL